MAIIGFEEFLNQLLNELNQFNIRELVSRYSSDVISSKSVKMNIIFMLCLSVNKNKLLVLK